MTDRADRGIWWDRPWGLTEGCTPVSPGCAHCGWAAAATHMRSKQQNPKIQARYGGLTTVAGAFNGTTRLMEDALELPLHVRKPTRWAIWNDLFHEQVPVSFIAAAFNTMASWRKSKGMEEEDAEDPGHTYLILTKQPKRMLRVLHNELPEYMSNLPGDTPLNLEMEVGKWPLPNVWLGTTCEDQQRADERIPLLLKTPAAGRFVSVEPMVGPVDWIKPAALHFQVKGQSCGWPVHSAIDRRDGISWVICGGETGPGARPMNLDWARSLRDQCQAAGVPFWLKNPHTLDGKVWHQRPEVRGRNCDC